MARHFVRLKLALLASGLRRSPAQRIGFALGVLGAVPAAIAGFLGLSLAGRSEEYGESILVVAFVFVFAAWLVLPVLAFASDETLDPARLALLPLTRRRLVAGLFAAAAVGLGPAATLVALAGSVHGFAWLGARTPLAAAAVVIQLALCVVASRAVTTALSAVLRSRRGRDVLVVLGGLLGGVVVLAWNAAVRLFDDVEQERFATALERAADVVGWLPPGLAARAVVDAGAGDLAAAAYELALAAAAVAVVAWLWGAALARSLTATAASTRRRARSESDLFPRAARFLPRSRRGAVAAKELRAWSRDPRLRATWLAPGVAGLAPVVLVALSDSRGPTAVLLPVALVWLASLHTFNQFGADGRAYWMNVAAAGKPRDDLVGKNGALALVLVAYVAVLACVLAVLTGGWAYVPVAVALALAALAASLAVGNVVSVRVPFPVQRSTTNIWAASGPGGVLFAMLVHFLALAVLGVLVTPMAIAVAVGFALGPPALAVAVVLALAYGLGLWRVGVLVADESLSAGAPELLERLSAWRA